MYLSIKFCDEMITLKEDLTTNQNISDENRSKVHCKTCNPSTEYNFES